MNNPLSLAVLGLITVSLVGVFSQGQALFTRIVQGIHSLRQLLFTWKMFFWMANIVCMVFSAQNAGFFFGLYEPIGVAVALVLDLAIIVFMQAMLAAKARGEQKRATQILWFIFLCAFLSTIGNLVHNLQVQDVHKIDHLTPWFQATLPFVASIVPMLLVVFALVADLVTKSNPLDETNVDAYREQETKRLALVEVQIQTRKREAELQKAALAVFEMERENKQRRKQIGKQKVTDKEGKNQGSKPQETTPPVNKSVESASQKVNAPVHTPVNTQPMHSMPESVPSTEQEKHTEALPVVDNEQGQNGTPDDNENGQETSQPVHNDRKQLNKKTPSLTNSDASKKVRRLLKKYPEKKFTEIAQLASVSRSYVSQIAKELENDTVPPPEQKAPAENTHHNGHSHPIEMSDFVPLNV